MTVRYYDYLVYIMRWLLLYTEPSATIYYRLEGTDQKAGTGGEDLPLLCFSAPGGGADPDLEERETGPEVYGLRTGSFDTAEEQDSDGKAEWTFLNDLPDFLRASLASRLIGKGYEDVRAIRPDDVMLEIFVITRKDSLIFSIRIEPGWLYAKEADEPEFETEAYLRAAFSGLPIRGRRMLTTEEYRLLVFPEERVRFDSLRKLRKSLADKRNVSAYVIFSNRALYELARKAPSCKEDLLAVNGIGERTFMQYGEDILACLMEHGNTRPIRFLFTEDPETEEVSAYQSSECEEIEALI
ncbi:MAG: HRDC domain-containing protein [Lachnospiraceae bacterium]|nr:HRDC domain-containing protein [Lachnospiraceae bacterium]